MRRAIWCLLAACGGGADGGGDAPLPTIEDCQMTMSLGGAVSANVSRGEATDCQGALDNGGDPIIAWFPEDDSMVMRIELELEAAVVGTIGEVAGKVGVISPTGFVWSGDCTFQVEYWNDTGTRAGGSGMCETLAAESGPSIVTVEPFDFDML